MPELRAMIGALVASTGATAALVAAAVAGGITLVAGVGWRFSRGSQPTPAEDRISGLVRDLDVRMEEMGRELTEALERAREETRRGRVIGELAGSIDLEDVMRRTLDAAGAVPGADAAAISVENSESQPVTLTVGLSPEEAEEHAVPQPAGRRIRSMAISYAPGRETTVGERPPITVGLAVPIHTQLETVGLLSVFSRGAADVFSESQLHELEDLAARAAPAVHNARRFREARQLADLDALTGLHNRRYFNETLSREVARAQRYNRRLGLLVFDLDDFKPINDQIGHLAGDSVLSEMAERVREVVRSSDIACRYGGDEFTVVMPESGLEDADQLYRRLQAQIAARPIGHAGRLLISAGIAELRPQDDPLGFFKRADDALRRAKSAGKGRAAS